MKPLIFIFLLSAPVLAQSGSLTGRITQAETGKPLCYTDITVDDTLHTYADYKGRYTIRNLTPGRHILVFSSTNLVSRIDTIVIRPSRTIRHRVALRHNVALQQPDSTEPLIIIQKWKLL